MQSYFGVAVLCIIPGMISYCISIKAFKGIKVIAFYVSIYAGALSAMKVLLHDGQLSVFESFEDILPVTYIHYAAPMLILGVVIPLLAQVKGIIRRNAVKFMYLVDSVLFFLSGIGFLIFGKITNRCYCFLLLCAVLLAVMACWRNKEIVFFGKWKKENLALAVTVSGFWAMTNLVFSTGELYLNNVADFPVSFASLMLSVSLAGAAYIALYTIGANIFLTKKQYQLFWAVIFILTLMEYVQGIALNGHLDTLEGIEQTWSAAAIYGNAAVWLFAAFAGIFLYVRNNGIVKLYRIACIYICLIQLVTLAYMGITTDFSKKDEYALTTDGMLEVDDENNVIVFVLDWFDEQILEWIQEEDPVFLEPLKDFTNYSNTTSCYSYTAMSIPYMFSGLKYQDEDTLEEWYAKAYADKSFLWEVNRLGYDIGIYTSFEYMDKSVQDIIINYSNEVERRCRLGDSVLLMQKCSRYKNMPFAFKGRYAYATEEIGALSVEGNKFMTNKDVWIYNDLVKKKLQVVDRDGCNGSFRFLHLRGAHPPISMNENFEDLDGKVELTHENWVSQAKGSIGIVYEYMEQMKQLGVYESATIMITADHGQNHYLDNEDGVPLGFEDHTSSPIMLVKQSGANGEGSMTESKAPTSHAELGASIIKAMGGDYKRYGRAFDEIGTDEDRVREFIYGRFGKAPFIHYNIYGDVRDFRNWVIE